MLDDDAGGDDGCDDPDFAGGEEAGGGVEWARYHGRPTLRSSIQLLLPQRFEELREGSLLVMTSRIQEISLLWPGSVVVRLPLAIGLCAAWVSRLVGRSLPDYRGQAGIRAPGNRGADRCWHHPHCWLL